MGKRKKVYWWDKEETSELEAVYKLFRSNSRTENQETYIKFWGMSDFESYCKDSGKIAISSPARIFGELLSTLETAYYKWYGKEINLKEIFMPGGKYWFSSIEKFMDLDMDYLYSELDIWMRRRWNYFELKKLNYYLVELVCIYEKKDNKTVYTTKRLPYYQGIIRDALNAFLYDAFDNKEKLIKEMKAEWKEIDEQYDILEKKDREDSRREKLQKSYITFVKGFYCLLEECQKEMYGLYTDCPELRLKFRKMDDREPKLSLNADGKFEKSAEKNFQIYKDYMEKKEKSQSLWELGLEIQAEERKHLDYI